MKNLYLLLSAGLLIGSIYWITNTNSQIDEEEVAYNNEPALGAIFSNNSSSEKKTKVKFEGDATFDSKDFGGYFGENSNRPNAFNIPNGEVNLSKFQISSEYGDFSTDMHASAKVKDDSQADIHYDHQVSFESSKEAYAHWQNEIDKLYKQIQDPNNNVQIDPQLREVLLCCHQQLKNLMPNWEELGKSSYYVNVDVKLLSPEKNHEGTYINVKNLDFTTSPYSIKSHGDATVHNKNLSGTYVVTITNYKKLITDGADYYNRALAIAPHLSNTDPRQLPQPVTAPQVNNFIDYLRYISDKPDSDGKDITITFNFVDANNIRIGTRTVQEVKAAWDRIIGNAGAGAEGIQQPQPQFQEDQQLQDDQQQHEMQRGLQQPSDIDNYQDDSQFNQRFHQAGNPNQGYQNDEQGFGAGQRGQQRNLNPQQYYRQYQYQY